MSLPSAPYNLAGGASALASQITKSPAVHSEAGDGDLGRDVVRRAEPGLS